jgi:hypothetical protein
MKVEFTNLKIISGLVLSICLTPMLFANEFTVKSKNHFKSIKKESSMSEPISYNLDLSEIRIRSTIILKEDDLKKSCNLKLVRKSDESVFCSHKDSSGEIYNFLLVPKNKSIIGTIYDKISRFILVEKKE